MPGFGLVQLQLLPLHLYSKLLQEAHGLQLQLLPLDLYLKLLQEAHDLLCRIFTYALLLLVEDAK